MIIKQKGKTTWMTEDFRKEVNAVFQSIRNHPKFNVVKDIRFTPPKGSIEYEYYLKQLKRERQARS